MRARMAVTLSLFVLCLATSTTGQNQTSPCSAPEARQFDFWVGSWTVHANDKVAGHNNITSIHNGCTVFEQYRAENSPYEGKSFNYYDSGDGKWHQIWVDSGGLRLHLTGTFADGKMVLSGERQSDGATVIDRISWFDNDDGTVRQLWEASRDGGKTWNTLFDGRYVRDSE